MIDQLYSCGGIYVDALEGFQIVLAIVAVIRSRKTECSTRDSGTCGGVYDGFYGVEGIVVLG